MDMIEEMIDSLANVGTIKNDFVKRGEKIRVSQSSLILSGNPTIFPRLIFHGAQTPGSIVFSHV